MTKHKSSDERRSQILAAARKCFVERGYESTRMQDISRESGLSKGGIYFHFDSKMDMFTALVDEEYATSMGDLADVIDAGGSIADRLTKLATSFLDAFSQQSDRANFFVVMSEVALREPAVKEKLQQLQEHYLELLTSFVEAGVESGDLRPVHPRAAAIFLKSLVDGLEANIALGIDLDLNSLIPAGLSLLLHGLIKSTGDAAVSNTG